VTGRAGASARAPGAVWGTAAGLCACLVGIGLARFAYTPLIPALIAAGWFSPAHTAYLGAANLAGYLVGALAARQLAARVPTVGMLRGMMLLATVAFFACATPVSFLWFFLWRFLAGLAGGSLMVLAPPTVLPYVPPARRGLAGGLIFTGVGLGIAASGTLVPLLLREGLVATWCGLGTLALVLTALSWRGWPAGPPPVARIVPPRAHATAIRHGGTGPLLAVLFVEYGLNATGLVPHMVFLVDFVARDLGQGLATGAAYWVVFGVGALLGPAAAGAAGDRVGFGPALRCSLLIQAAAVGVLALTAGPAALAVSSFVIGAFVPGCTTLVLGRVRELVADGSAAHQTAAWSRATMAFALGQAVAAYGFSFIFARSGGYALLFALGGGVLLVAFMLDLAGALRSPTPPRRGAARAARRAG
jgi:predicted MFS family arabinose efflux permease